MNDQMIISLVAMDKNNVIGVDNKLPWRLSADLQRFKKLTMGCPIIMGRKTFESIGRALPGRRNIIVSRNPKLKIENCDVAHSLEDALNLVKEDPKVFVTGGAEIYRLAMPFVTHLYVTAVDTAVKGDVAFPDIDLQEWSLESEESHPADEKNDFLHRYLVFSRKNTRS